MNRVGRKYLIDDYPHICIEDNGNRGLFQANGTEFDTWSIKPVTLALFSDAIEIKGLED
jgi:hypothetical protein